MSKLRINSNDIKNPKALAAVITKYNGHPDLPRAIAAAIKIYVLDEIQKTGFSTLLLDVKS